MKKLERGLRESSKSLYWHSDVRVVMMSWQEADTNMWEEGASSWQLTDSLPSERTCWTATTAQALRLKVELHTLVPGPSQSVGGDRPQQLWGKSKWLSHFENSGRISSTHKEDYTGEMMFEVTWKPWRIRRILPGSMLGRKEDGGLKALATLWAKRTVDYSLHRTVSSMP